MRMRSHFYQITIVLIAILFSGCSIQADSTLKHQPKAVKGILDLSQWDLERNGVVKLDGEWEFYWLSFINPNQFVQNNVLTQAEYFRLPASWNDTNDTKGQTFSGEGYATYRLSIILKNNQTIEGLYLPSISSAYKLWVNGTLQSQVGVIGADRSSMKPAYLPKIIPVFSGNQELRDKKEIQLVLQVSNFYHRRGGVWNSLELGTMDQIQQLQIERTGKDLFLFGGLLIIGLYFMGLFILRREDRTPLYFGGLCLLIGLRILFVDEQIIYRMLPGFSWSSALRMEYIGLYFSIPLSLLYMNAMYPEESSKKMTTSFSIITILLTLLILVTPTYIFTQIHFANQAVTILAALYVLFMLSKAMKLQRQGATLTAIGVLLYFLTLLNDMLYYNEVLHTGDLSPIGLFFFVMIQSYLLSIKSSRAFRSVEEISHELANLNSSLEEKIKERTNALEQVNLSLMQKNEELTRMETSRRHLLTNISHDLGTPITLIQGYVEALLDGVVEESGKREKYLSLIHTRVISLNRLIQDLYDLSILEARRVKFNFHWLTLERFMDYFLQRYEPEITNAGRRFIWDKPDMWETIAPTLNLGVDLDQLDRVFTNIVYNAFKHTEKGGSIRFSLEIFYSEIRLSIEDNGTGIEALDLPFIFDRFYKKDKSRNSATGGSGLGLAIAKEIVEFHGGRIGAKNSSGSGATFYFTLPLGHMNDFMID